MQVPSNYSLKDDNFSLQIPENSELSEDYSFDLIFKTTAKLCRDFVVSDNHMSYTENDPVSERIRKYIININ